MGSQFRELLFIKLNQSGDTVSTFQFGDQNNLQLTSVVQSQIDSAFYLTGYLFTSNATTDSATFLVKLDQVGHIVWQKKYSFPNSISHFLDAKIVDNDSLFILGRNESGAFLLKMDLNRTVGQFYLINNLFPSHFLVSSNHNLTFTGGEVDNLYPGYASTIIHTTSGGQMIWNYCESAGDYYFGQIVENLNGDFCIEYNRFLGINQIAFSALCAFDSTGLFKWAKIYGCCSILGEHLFHTLTLIPNNGIRISGSPVFGYGRDFIIETDSNGVCVNSMLGPDSSYNRSNASYHIFDLGNSKRLIAGFDNVSLYNPSIDDCHLTDTLFTTDQQFYPLFPTHNSKVGFSLAPNSFTDSTITWTISSGIEVNPYCLSLDISEEKEFSPLIYPNPSAGNIHFNFPYNEKLILF